MPLKTSLIVIALFLIMPPLHAAEIRIAVASNFADPATTLAKQFEAQTEHKVILNFGSTGKHYAQILHGAPFDIFFAANEERPRRLEQEGFAVSGSRFTCAIGQLVLWSPQAGYVDDDGKVLERGDFRFLAIANPRLAPYGRAAQQVLQVRGVWESIQDKLVRGENIAQTYQFVSSGNAQLGLVAYSQVKRPDQPVRGSLWEIPPQLYTSIRQQAVLLRETPAARAFLDYVRSTQALRIIREYGYDTE